MALNRIESVPFGAEIAAPHSAADTLVSLLAADGATNHPYITTDIFAGGRDAARNLADAVHYLCHLHGDYPGIIDIAWEGCAFPPATEWLDRAAASFSEERAYFTRVVVAAGPMPSTPGQAESNAAVTGQRHALEMLAKSERTGCAIGAAIAVALDWRAIRKVIDVAAQRFGVPLTPPSLPSSRETLGVAAATLGTPGIERALVFGAQQLLVQHRGLWDLLEARQIARIGS
jgi:hypothetical protein